MKGKLFFLILSTLFLSHCTTIETPLETSTPLKYKVPPKKQKQEKEVAVKKKVDYLQKQIKELESKIEKLQKENFLLKEELRKKNKIIYSLKKEKKIIVRMPTGEEIQTALKNAGFYKGKIDGKIGEGTKQAIKEFQKANGLVADGIVGSKTWEKLRNYISINE